MANDKQTIEINGHKWQTPPDPYSRETYRLSDVERCGGDPERVKRECPTFDGRTFTMSNAN
jgi:hypothetical protein